MASSNTCTKASSGFTLTELIITVAVGTVFLAVVANMAIYFSRSVGVLEHYVDLNYQSRLAFDLMSREIRQADKVESNSVHSLTIRSGTNLITYTYAPDEKIIARKSNGESSVLLSQCDGVQFDLFQRNPTNGTYDYYPAASAANCKVVQVSWRCSRKLIDTKPTETVQSGRVVIRKQR